MRRSGLVSVLVGMCACSASPGMNPGDGAIGGAGGTGGTPASASGGAGGAAAGVDAGPPSPMATAAAQCQRPLFEKLTVDSIAAMQAILRRTWVSCSNPALFHRPQDGMLIDANDRFTFLTWSGGALVPQTGADNQGTVQYIDNSMVNGYPSLSFSFVRDSDGGTISAGPVISDDPRTILIDNEGVETYAYTAADAVLPPAGTPDAGMPVSQTPFSPDQAAALCARPLGERLPLTDVNQVRTLIQRPWVLCSPTGFWGIPQAGMVIDPDDRIALLQWSGGQLVSESGLDHEGTASYGMSRGSDGTVHVDVVFTSDLGGANGASPPIFSDDPRVLIVNDSGIVTYTYAAVP